MSIISFAAVKARQLTNAILATTLLAGSCGGGGSDSGKSVPNVAPTAHAGPAQSVAAGSVVTLNGGGSSDANGDTLAFRWSLASRPDGSSAALSGANTVAPTFTADLAGTYAAELVVSDGALSSAPATVSITAACVATAPVLAVQQTYGGSGDDFGRGIAVDSKGVFFSGTEPVLAQGNGVVAQYPHSLGPMVWSRRWLRDSGFNGITLQGGSIYVVGSSTEQTVDTVGDKEGKGITLRFPADGSAGAGPGGAAWVTQTPSAPGGFPYGGIESIVRVASATEAGSEYVYALGRGQRDGVSLPGTFLVKLSAAGQVLWARGDSTPSHPGSWLGGLGLFATGDAIYIAARSDASGARPYLRRYAPDGALAWAKTSSTVGEYRGLTVIGTTIYAVGRTNPDGSNSDFLIEAWDHSGNMIWSRAVDRSGANDSLNAVTMVGSKLYAVGTTAGAPALGADGVILELDPTDGRVLSTTLWGGTGDDTFEDAAGYSGALYVVGSTKSLGSGGSDVVLASYRLGQCP